MKKTYQAPQLKVHGNMTEVTLQNVNRPNPDRVIGQTRVRPGRS